MTGLIIVMTIPLTALIISMMKRVCIAVLVLFMALNSMAQIDFTLVGGVNASKAKYGVSNVKQPGDFKYGFHMGLNMNIPFENKLSFTPGASYKMMGYKVQFNKPSFPPDLLAKDNNTSFHQIDLDLLLKFIFSNNPAHFYIKAGPSFGIILFGKEKFNLATGENISRNMTFSTMHHYGRYMVSLVAELGYDLPNGFTVYSHYQHGVVSLNNEVDGPEILTRYIGIGIGKKLNW